MTHRVFSRNASSSRAIPVARTIADVKADPAMPAEWRMNEAGMQGFTKAPIVVAAGAEKVMKVALNAAIDAANQLVTLGLHKQHINRLLEPFAHIRVVLTATQFKNWYALRDHPDADPSIRMVADLMNQAQTASTPVTLASGDWHLPYCDDADSKAACTAYAASTSKLDLDRANIRTDDPALTALEVMKRVSAARCARTSYKSFKTGANSTVAEDMELFDKLVKSDLIHASPTEHQATPDFWLTRNRRWMTPAKHGNLVGWNQFRKFLPNENLDEVVGAES